MDDPELSHSFVPIVAIAGRVDLDPFDDRENYQATVDMLPIAPSRFMNGGGANL
jgi:hypothetical protein